MPCTDSRCCRTPPIVHDPDEYIAQDFKPYWISLWRFLGVGRARLIKGSFDPDSSPDSVHLPVHESPPGGFSLTPHLIGYLIGYLIRYLIGWVPDGSPDGSPDRPPDRSHQNRSKPLQGIVHLCRSRHTLHCLAGRLTPQATAHAALLSARLHGQETAV